MTGDGARARIDPTRCKAYSVCANLLPTMFLIDEWGFAYVRDGAVTAENERQVRRAIRGCPVQAIAIVE